MDNFTLVISSYGDDMLLLDILHLGNNGRGSSMLWTPKYQTHDNQSARDATKLSSVNI